MELLAYNLRVSVWLSQKVSGVALRVSCRISGTARISFGYAVQLQRRQCSAFWRRLSPYCKKTKRFPMMMSVIGNFWPINIFTQVTAKLNKAKKTRIHFFGGEGTLLFEKNTSSIVVLLAGGEMCQTYFKMSLQAHLWNCGGDHRRTHAVHDGAVMHWSRKMTY